MRKRIPILMTVLVVAAVAIATAVGGTAASYTGAQANLNKHKAVPKFVAPGPAFDAKAKAGGKTGSHSG